MAESKYLGLKLLLAEGDEHLLQSFLRRSSSAFFTNRPLLTSGTAPKHLRLRMFHSLVTSTILWSLAVLAPLSTHHPALHIQHVTLTGWMLRCAPHFSRQDVQCIPCARHAVKLWLRCYSKLWDQVLLEQQWNWLGHILRTPSNSILHQALVNLLPTSRDFGHRRVHPGPNNSGHRILLRWLRHQSIDLSLAHDRAAWGALASRWLCRFGVCPATRHINLLKCAPTDYLPDDYRGIQGCFHGQQIFVISILTDNTWVVCELDRTEGWRRRLFPAGLNFAGFHSILAQCLQQWCRPNTFHCRCLLIPLLDMSFQFIWDGLPASCDLCKAQSLVCEISTVPPLKLALDLLSGSS